MTERLRGAWKGVRRAADPERPETPPSPSENPFSLDDLNAETSEVRATAHWPRHLCVRPKNAHMQHDFSWYHGMLVGLLPQTAHMHSCTLDFTKCAGTHVHELTAHRAMPLQHRHLPQSCLICVFSNA